MQISDTTALPSCVRNGHSREAPQIDVSGHVGLGVHGAVHRVRKISVPFTGVTEYRRHRPRVSGFHHSEEGGGTYPSRFGIRTPGRLLASMTSSS